MDLFHAVTQGIENVLTCDWHDSFTKFMADNKQEEKTMDTVPGGETSQYAHQVSRCCESGDYVLTLSADTSLSRPRLFLLPNNGARWVVRILHLPPPLPYSNTLTGDFANTSETPPVDQERGGKTADNIRYGQNISESGMGGKTTAAIGSASQEGGFGGVPRQPEKSEDARKQQGYGQGSDIGA